MEWTTGDVMPQQLIDLLVPTEEQPITPDTQACNDAECHYETFEDEIEEDCEIDNIIDVIFDDEDDD